MNAALRSCRALVACLLLTQFVLAAPNVHAQSDAAVAAQLTLDAALREALEAHPSLEAYSEGVRAAEARRVQAGLLPNPELALEIEDIQFSDDSGAETHSFDAANVFTETERERTSTSPELTLTLSQLVELGGKRVRRVGAGEQEIAAAAWEYETARLDVLTTAAEAFIRAYSAQMAVVNAEDSLSLSGEMLRTIEARVEAGGASPIESSRARLERSSAEIAAEDARRGLDAARGALAYAMGLEDASFGALSGDLETLPEIPAWETVRLAAETNPDLLRWQTEVAWRESLLAVERANRWPDLTVTAGWRTIGAEDTRSQSFDAAGVPLGSARSRGDDREHSFLVGFSIPVPIFNRNQGNVREAEHRLSRASAETRSARLAVQAALREAWLALSSAESRVRRLRDEVVPEARRIFDATSEGYREGKFDYLSVLDAQRTLFELRAQLADAQTGVHLAAIDVERLAGSIADLAALELNQE